MSRPRVLLDVDGVVADLVGDLCRELTAKGHHRIPNEIVTYRFEDCLSPAEARLCTETMVRPGFCRNLAWYWGGRTFVEKLKLRADVVAVTKPHPLAPTWAHERAAWLEGTVDRVVHTGHKELVAGDYLVEDSVENAVAWNAAHEGIAILLTRPWNARERNLPAGVVRVGSFDEALEAIR